MAHYGKCECGESLHPVWFIENETKVIGGRMTYTGRERKAISHLECHNCFKNYCVDDSFDGDWRFPIGKK